MTKVEISGAGKGLIGGWSQGRRYRVESNVTHVDCSNNSLFKNPYTLHCGHFSTKRFLNIGMGAYSGHSGAAATVQPNVCKDPLTARDDATTAHPFVRSRSDRLEEESPVPSPRGVKTCGNMRGRVGLWVQGAGDSMAYGELD
jgi:hypothetical protein